MLLAASGVEAQKFVHDFDHDTLALQQVVVTGTRTPKSLANTPVPTSLITHQEIERADATDIQALLQQEMPGVEFSYAMNQQTHLNLSGFGGQGILFLVDGERLAGETMDDVDFSRLVMTGIERVEIVKGAASALYGSNAGGGVVNIITRQGRQPWHITADTQWSRHNGQRYNLVNDINQKQWHNNLSASWSSVDNFTVNSGANPVTRVFSEVYGNRTLNVKERLTFDASDQLKLTGRMGYFFRQVPRSPSEPERYRDYSAGLKGNWLMSDADQLEISYAFDQYDKSVKQKALGLDVRTYSNVHNSVRALYNHDFAGDMLTIGGDVMHDYLMNTKLTDRTRTQNTFDAFVQYDWNLSSQWEVVGALRYDFFSDGHLSRVTPKLSARYQPDRHLNLRLGYGMGFRAPTLKEKYSEFDMSGIWIVEGSKNLRPESSHNLNLSAEYARGRYNMMVMGYYNQVRNKISTGVPYYASDGSKQLRLPYNNLEHYSVYGAEASAHARWQSVSAKIAYAYTCEHLPKDGNGNTINNQYIPARPHSLTAEVTYDHAFSADYRLSVTLNGRWLSTVDNEEYRDYYDISKGTATVCYPAYSLWRLSVQQWLWQRLKLTVTLDNLLNYKPKYYYLNAPITDGTNLKVGIGIDLN